MTEAEARARLETMVASGSAPTLTTTEVDDLMVLARRADAYGVPPYSTWRATSRYEVGEYVVPSPRNAHLYRVTVAGTAGSAAPAWPLTSGTTVVDSGVTWTESGLTAWLPSFDLAFAAAEGWRRKAAKVAGSFSFSTDGQSFNRREQHEMCLAQAKAYAAQVVQSVSYGGADAWCPAVVGNG